MSAETLSIISFIVSIVLLVVFFVMARNVHKILVLLRQLIQDNKKISGESNNKDKTDSRSDKIRNTSTEQTSVNDPENFDKMVEKFANK